MDPASFLAALAAATGAGTTGNPLVEAAVAEGYAVLKQRLANTFREPKAGPGQHAVQLALEAGPAETDIDFAAALSKLREDTGVSLRTLAPKVGKSPATLSRIFNGKIVPTRSVLMNILSALEAPAPEGQLIVNLWREAMRTGPQTGKTTTAGATAMSDGPETEIVVHGGSIMFTGKDSTAGRTIVVHGGEVTFCAEAAVAANQIVVHGGDVTIGDQPPGMSSQHGGGAERDEEDPPESGRHLRRVS